MAMIAARIATMPVISARQKHTKTSMQITCGDFYTPLNASRPRSRYNHLKSAKFRVQLSIYTMNKTDTGKPRGTTLLTHGIYGGQLLRRGKSVLSPLISRFVPECKHEFKSFFLCVCVLCILKRHTKKRQPKSRNPECSPLLKTWDLWQDMWKTLLVQLYTDFINDGYRPA